MNRLNFLIKRNILQPRKIDNLDFHTEPKTANLETIYTSIMLNMESTEAVDIIKAYREHLDVLESEVENLQVNMHLKIADELAKLKQKLITQVRQ